MILTLAWLALQVLPAGDISGFGGGSATSPDHRWTVSADPVDPDGESLVTTAWLTEQGGTRRPLLHFERDLEVIWLGDGRHALAIERTIHFSNVRLVDLNEGRETDSIERQAEIALSQLAPRLRSIENRLVAVGGTAQRPCLIFEESGLPPGRAEGSFISRRAVFSVDIVDARLRLTETCSGARIK